MTNQHYHRPPGFYRDTENATLLGVCAGLAEKQEVDVDVVRLVVGIAIFMSGIFPGLFIYMLIGFIMPPRRRYLADDEGRAEPVGSVIRDVKERHQARKEAKEAHREQKRTFKENRKAAKKAGMSVEAYTDKIASEKAERVSEQQLRRKFADLENRTSAMESEVTSSRFKLERELKRLEDDKE